MLDMLDWCRKCKNKCTEKDKMRLGCLGCKWQYVGGNLFLIERQICLKKIFQTKIMKRPMSIGKGITLLNKKHILLITYFNI